MPLLVLCPVSCHLQKSFTSEERKKAGGNSSSSQQSAGDGKRQYKRPSAFTSSTALTPGTPFMHDVCVSISHFVCAKLGQDKWRHVSAGAEPLLRRIRIACSVGIKPE